MLRVLVFVIAMLLIFNIAFIMCACKINSKISRMEENDKIFKEKPKNKA